MRTRKKSLFWLPVALAAAALGLPLATSARVDAGPSGHAVDVVQYPIPKANTRPYTIVAGPDGNVWFTESSIGAIGRITPSGEITQFALPNPKSNPYGITRGADGNLWFTERLADRIGKITPGGVITEYSGLTANSQPWDITALPDGTFWFTEENADQIGRIDQAGNVTEYPAGEGTLPTHITTGPDGNIWYTEELGNHIVRLNPNNPSERTRFPLLTDGALPWDITTGPDGNLWFTTLAARVIGKITPTGVVTEYTVPGDFGIAGIAAGPDGRMWFTENDSGQVGSITVGGQVGAERFTTGSYPFGITAGPDRNMWFCRRVRQRDRQAALHPEELWLRSLASDGRSTPRSRSARSAAARPGSAEPCTRPSSSPCLGSCAARACTRRPPRTSCGSRSSSSAGSRARRPKDPQAGAVEIAKRKGAGNVVELGSIVAFGFSPLWLLAAASDLTRGSRVYLKTLEQELKAAGVIAEDVDARLGRRAARGARAHVGRHGAPDRHSAARAQGHAGLTG